MTSPYSKTLVFARPHENHKPALKKNRFWKPSILEFEKADSIWTEALSGE